MKHAVLIIFLFLSFILSGCSGNKAAELYETAGFEELQDNKDHALQLYQEIIKKYPDSEYAKKAGERISEIEKSNMRR